MDSADKISSSSSTIGIPTKLSSKVSKQTVNGAPNAPTNKENLVKGFKGQLKHQVARFSVPKKTEKSDKTDRFSGEGVSFKGKLIGILEVDGPRGERICMNAMQELKTAVKAAGEHKQKITIVLTTDGLQLRDERSKECLHRHWIKKISFIYQDVTDTRAFAYVYGTPDNGFQLFGIKTEKCAGQVVLAIKELFQSVFEAKKVEVEVAKQMVQHHRAKGTIILPECLELSSSDTIKPLAGNMVVFPVPQDYNKDSKDKSATDVISDLMNLELELSCLQQGLQHVGQQCSDWRRTDPFGDSFAALKSTKVSVTPPPFKSQPLPGVGTAAKKASSTSSIISNDSDNKSWLESRIIQSAVSGEKSLPSFMNKLDGTGNKSQNNQVSHGASLFPVASTPATTTAGGATTYGVEKKHYQELLDLFVDLDPLGTGKSKPYVDKKDFFQDLKSVQIADSSSKEESKSEVSMEVASNSEVSAATSNKDLDYPESKLGPDFQFESGFADFSTFNKSPYSTRKSQLAHTDSASSQGSLQASSYHTANNASNCKLQDAGVSSPPKDGGTKASNWRLNNPPTNEKIVIDLRRVMSNDDDTDKENDDLENDGYARSYRKAFSDSCESIPKIPPRPFASPLTIAPPPLPPKMYHCVTNKPPPRPPSAGSNHYDYIENYESSKKSDNDWKIPALPAPMRKSKFGNYADLEYKRPSFSRTHSKSTPTSETEYYLSPISRPQVRSVDVLNESTPKPQTKPINTPLDITLSQLTHTGFQDLSKSLGIPVGDLSKMTLIELTECLAKMNKAESKVNAENKKDESFVAPDSGIFSFKETFNSSSHASSERSTPPCNAVPTDKYSVLREYIEQEANMQPSIFVSSANSEVNSGNVSMDSENLACAEPIDLSAETENVPLCDNKEESGNEESISPPRKSSQSNVEKQNASDLLSLSLYDSGHCASSENGEDKKVSSEQSWHKFTPDDAISEEVAEKNKNTDRVNYPPRRGDQYSSDTFDDDDDDYDEMEKEEYYGDASDDNGGSSRRSSWDESGYRGNVSSDKESPPYEERYPAGTSRRAPRYAKGEYYSLGITDAPIRKSREYKESKGPHRVPRRNRDERPGVKLHGSKHYEDRLYASRFSDDTKWHRARSAGRPGKKDTLEEIKFCPQRREQSEYDRAGGGEYFARKTRPVSHSASDDGEFEPSSPSFKKRSQLSPFEDDFAPPEYATSSHYKKSQANVIADRKAPRSLEGYKRGGHYSQYQENMPSESSSSHRRSSFDNEYFSTAGKRTQRRCYLPESPYYSPTAMSPTKEGGSGGTRRSSDYRRYDEECSDFDRSVYENVDVRRRTTSESSRRKTTLPQNDPFRYYYAGKTSGKTRSKNSRSSGCSNPRKSDPFNDNEGRSPYASSRYSQQRPAKMKPKAKKYDSSGTGASSPMESHPNANRKDEFGVFTAFREDL